MNGNEASSSRSSFDKNFVQNSRVRIDLAETPSEVYPVENAAACVIQRAWRKHVVSCTFIFTTEGHYEKLIIINQLIRFLFPV